MDENVSRSEKKRQSKGVETLVHELIALSAKDIRTLPCDDAVKDEILVALELKGSALKRQAKYIAKMLRSEAEAVGELLSYMEEKKGSKLKEDGEFHELERLRDAIINDAIVATDARLAVGRLKHPADKFLEAGAEGNSLETALIRFPGLAEIDLRKAAVMYAETRQPRYSREIFRMLKAALERRKYEKDS
jgi:ribosome-associated protein